MWGRLQKSISIPINLYLGRSKHMHGFKGVYFMPPAAERHVLFFSVCVFVCVILFIYSRNSSGPLRFWNLRSRSVAMTGAAGIIVGRRQEEWISFLANTSRTWEEPSQSDLQPPDADWEPCRTDPQNGSAEVSLNQMILLFILSL